MCIARNAVSQARVSIARLSSSSHSSGSSDPTDSCELERLELQAAVVARARDGKSALGVGARLLDGVAARSCIAVPRRTSSVPVSTSSRLADLAERFVGDPRGRHELNLQVEHEAQRRRRPRDARPVAGGARELERLLEQARAFVHVGRRSGHLAEEREPAGSGPRGRSARARGWSSSRAPSCAASSSAASAARSNHVRGKRTALVPLEPRCDLPCKRRHALERPGVVPRDRLGDAG